MDEERPWWVGLDGRPRWLRGAKPSVRSAVIVLPGVAVWTLLTALRLHYRAHDAWRTAFTLTAAMAGILTVSAALALLFVERRRKASGTHSGQ